MRGQLETRLDWAWAGTTKEKRIEQCRIRLESFVLKLWRRGWMLDGKRLARHITEMLDAVAKYQRSGKVHWACNGPALPEVIAQRTDEITKAKDQTLRENIARKRARDAAAAAEADQPRLL